MVLSQTLRKLTIAGASAAVLLVGQAAVAAQGDDDKPAGLACQRLEPVDQIRIGG